MPSVNYPEVKKLVTMEDLLRHYGISVRCTNPHTKQFKGRCPLPTHSVDSKESFEVNFEKNAFQCWARSCGGKGSTLDFVMLMEGLNAYNAALKILEWFGTKKESLPTRSEGSQTGKEASLKDEGIRPAPRLQVVNPRKEDFSLVDWLEKSAPENISEGAGPGSQPVPSNSSAQAPVGQKGFMKTIDVWLDDLLQRRNESEEEYWHRIRNGIKKKLIDNYRELRKEVARTA